MTLREMYHSIASGEFAKTCDKYSIDLRASFFEINIEKR